MPNMLLSAYRLVAPRWADTAFSGEGARKFGGRWHSPGRPVVYLSESRALSALELLVHLTTPRSRNKPFVLIEATIPLATINTVPLHTLSTGWNTSPPTQESTGIGDCWLEEGTSLALRVPSSVIPEETNILLNVTHPDFSYIQLGISKDFTYDTRL